MWAPWGPTIVSLACQGAAESHAPHPHCCSPNCCRCCAVVRPVLLPLAATWPHCVLLALGAHSSSLWGWATWEGAWLGAGAEAGCALPTLVTVCSLVCWEALEAVESGCRWRRVQNGAPCTGGGGGLLPPPSLSSPVVESSSSEAGDADGQSLGMRHGGPGCGDARPQEGLCAAAPPPSASCSLSAHTLRSVL